MSKNIKLILFLLFIYFFPEDIFGQSKLLDTVTITAYLNKQPLLSTPASAIVVGRKEIERKAFQSFLPVLNSFSGVRMEERSPASYRLAIRGSSLRSPFGIRNIKIYIDDFPLTDAGGNTYLNLIPPSGTQKIEILKGPDGSLFGANSAGVLLLQTFSDTENKGFNFQKGSFGFMNENAQFQNKSGKFRFNIKQDFTQSNGYRENSAMRRMYVQTGEKFSYGNSNELKFTGLFSQLNYQTPGGLTETQYKNNPAMARPATATTPSAVTQKAGIFNESVFLGISNKIQLLPNLKHAISLSGLISNFKNPFITNYETRKENSIAFRSYFNLDSKLNPDQTIQSFIGYEYQATASTIQNFVNLAGEKGEALSGDHIQTQQQFIFAKALFQLGLHLKAEAGLSYNFYQYQFKNIFGTAQNNIGERAFKPQLMPRFATSYLLNNHVALRATISRGFSTPTTAEVRASDAIINNSINPETGVNYEFGIRMNDKKNRFYADIAAFTYQLKNAIVRRTKENDQDYYVNAGGNHQRGVEAQLSYEIVPIVNGIVKSVLLQSAITISNFRFSNYQIGTADFSNNLLTGVPKSNFSNSIEAKFNHSVSLSFNYQHTSKIPLNDSNSAFSDAYDIVQGKINWQKKINKNTILNFTAGADNILNQDYSLGNDLNAFGGRFYNAAPKRNYFFGIGVQIK